MTTFYDTLGVPRHAKASDIELSYRNGLNEQIAGSRNQPLRKKDQLRQQQFRQAYLVLSSPSQRMEYDLKLDQLEHACLRKIERLGTVFALLLLVAGLALIACGYYRQVYEGKTSVQAAGRESTARTTGENLLFTTGNRPVSQVLHSRSE